MGIKLPMIKSDELVRALKKLGFFEHRQSGTSHLVMKHEDGKRVIIPIHSGQDIPRGTLKGILRDCNISNEKFHELL